MTRRPKGRHIGEAERAEIRHAIGQGLSVSEIRRRYGYAEGTIRSVRDEGNGPTLSDSATKDGLIVANAPSATIQVDRSQILRVLEEMGLLAPSAVPPTVEPAPTPPPLPPIGHTRVVVDDSKPERVAFLSDLHVPFLCERAWGAAMSLLEDYQPDLIVLGGDLFDFYSISAHDKEPGRLDRLQDEFDAASPLWAQVDKLAGRKVVIWGNHEERLIRLTHANPGLVNLRALTIEAAADMPKGWTYYPNQTRLKVGPLSILHGDLKGRGTSSVHAASGMLRKLRTSCLSAISTDDNSSLRLTRMARSGPGSPTATSPTPIRLTTSLRRIGSSRSAR